MTAIALVFASWVAAASNPAIPLPTMPHTPVATVDWTAKPVVSEKPFAPMRKRIEVAQTHPAMATAGIKLARGHARVLRLSGVTQAGST